MNIRLFCITRSIIFTNFNHDSVQQLLQQHVYSVHRIQLRHVLIKQIITIIDLTFLHICSRIMATGSERKYLYIN